MGSKVQTIIREIGWDNTYRLPAANIENVERENEVKGKAEACEDLLIQIESIKQKIENNEEHVKNIENEIQQTQHLLRAHQKEMEAEEHMIHLAYRESNWLYQDSKRMMKEMSEHEKSCKHHEVAMENHQKKLKDLQKQMQIDERSLEDWLNVITKHDDDKLALEHYTKHDEQKMNKLQLDVKQLGQELDKHKQTLSRLTDEARSVQMEMDKTAEEYRSMHDQRQSLIKEWEATITQLKQRDTDIDSILVEVSISKRSLKTKMQSVDERVQFLQQLQHNNQEEESALSQADRNLDKLRQKHMQHTLNLTKTVDELNALHIAVMNATVELQSLRNEIKVRDKSIENITKKYVHNQRQIDNLNRISSQLDSDLVDAATKVALGEKIFRDEEFRHKNIEQEMNHLLDSRFRKYQEVEKVTADEKVLIAELQGCRSSIQNMKKRLLALERMAQRQEEVIYGQDIVVQQLEDKIGRMTGQKNVVQKSVLEEKIQQLEENLDDKETTVKYIIQQMKFLRDDIARHKRELDKQRKIKDDLVNKMTDLELYIDKSEISLKDKVSKKQNLMVEENLLKLNLKKQQDELNNKADQVYNLEKRKLQLENAMKERLREITMQRDLFRIDIKVAEDARATLNLEVTSKRSKLVKLKNRYEIFVAMMDRGDQGGGDQPCHMKYFIQAVQEKQKLQLEGDELDAKIQKADNEIVALENTLRLMTLRTESLRRTFNPVTKTSEECEEKQQIENQLYNMKEKCRIKRQQRNEIASELEKLNEISQTLRREENALNYSCEELTSHLANLGYQLQEQFKKLDRAVLQKGKHVKLIRQDENTKQKTLIETDVDVRVLKETNKYFIQSLKEFVKLHPECANVFNFELAKANLSTLDAPTPDSISSLSVRSASSLCSTASHSSRVSSPPSIVNITLPTDLTSAPSQDPKECSLTKVPSIPIRHLPSITPVEPCSSEKLANLELLLACGSEIMNVKKAEQYEQKRKEVCAKKGMSAPKIKTKIIRSTKAAPTKSKSVCSIEDDARPSGSEKDESGSSK